MTWSASRIAMSHHLNALVSSVAFFSIELVCQKLTLVGFSVRLLQLNFISVWFGVW